MIQNPKPKMRLQRRAVPGLKTGFFQMEKTSIPVESGSSKNRLSVMGRFKKYQTNVKKMKGIEKIRELLALETQFVFNLNQIESKGSEFKSCLEKVRAELKSLADGEKNGR